MESPSAAVNGFRPTGFARHELRSSSDGMRDYRRLDKDHLNPDIRELSLSEDLLRQVLRPRQQGRRCRRTVSRARVDEEDK